MATPPDGPLGQAPKLPDGTPAPLSPGFVAGGFVFLSGQLSFNRDGALDSGDIATQTRLCLQNLEYQLRAAGLDRDDIVKVTAWLTRAEDFGGFNAAYSDFFGEHRPARSTVCAALLIPGARVEVEAIAQMR